MARMTKSFLTTLVLAIFLLLIVDSFTNAIYACDNRRSPIEPLDLKTPEQLWRTVELENSPPNLLVTPPTVLTFDRTAIEKMLSPDCQIFDRDNSTEARLTKKLNLLRNRQRIESALNFATPSEIFEDEVLPGASLHAMPTLLWRLDWDWTQKDWLAAGLEWKHLASGWIADLGSTFPTSSSLECFSDRMEALVAWTDFKFFVTPNHSIAIEDQELLPLPKAGGVMIGSLRVARHHWIEPSNTIVLQVPAGEAPLKGMSQRQIDLILQTVSAEFDDYWQYYEDCDYWKVRFTTTSAAPSLNHVTAESAGNETSSKAAAKSIEPWSRWGVLEIAELQTSFAEGLNTASAALITRAMELEELLGQIKQWLDLIEFELVETA